VMMTMWRDLSPQQRGVLARLRKDPSSAYRLRCSIATLCALERRKLIRVETTFGGIAFPRNAMAWITDAGRAAIGECSPDSER
jgi:hypothetical protein